MNPFPSIPFLRFCIPYIMGIIIYQSFPSIYIFAFVVLITVIFIIYITPSSIFVDHTTNRILGLVITFLCMVLGIMNTHKSNIKKNIQPLNEYQIHLIKITETPYEKGKIFKAKGKILLSINQDDTLIVSEGILITAENKENITPFKYGDVIMTKSKIEIPYGYQNPRQFNYQQYLASIGINYQTYCKTDDFKIISNNNESSLENFIEISRKKILMSFERAGLKGDEYAVAAALLIGYKNDLTKEIKSNYSEAGVMHILAVSGMHVGVIYMFMIKILFFLKSRKQEILRFVIVFIFLWIYILITGLSPSVLRAGVMFSFISIGNVFYKKTNIINILFLSAFILLLINPNNLYDIGFQLSYLAVLGIVIFYKKIKDLYFSKYYVVNEAWSIIAVSIAAQLFTTPISLYHFGQFPLYFLLANLILVPLSGIIIYTGISVIGISSTPYLGKAAGWLFQKQLFLMNETTHFIHALPYSSIKGVYISFFQCCILYIIITYSYLFIKNQKRYNTIIVCTGFLIFTFTLFINEWNKRRQKLLVFYSIKKEGEFDLIKGKKAYSLTGNHINTREYNQYIKTHQDWLGVYERKYLNSRDTVHYLNNYYFQINNKKAGIVDDLILLPQNDVELDMTLIQTNTWKAIDKIDQRINSNIWILDAGITEYSRKKYIEYFESKKYSFIDLKQSGAFILHL